MSTFFWHLHFANGHYHVAILL